MLLYCSLSADAPCFWQEKRVILIFNNNAPSWTLGFRVRRDGLGCSTDQISSDIGDWTSATKSTLQLNPVCLAQVRAREGACGGHCCRGAATSALEGAHDCVPGMHSRGRRTRSPAGRPLECWTVRLLPHLHPRRHVCLPDLPGTLLLTAVQSSS